MIYNQNEKTYIFRPENVLLKKHMVLESLSPMGVLLSIDESRCLISSSVYAVGTYKPITKLRHLFFVELIETLFNLDSPKSTNIYVKNRMLKGLDFNLFQAFLYITILFT